MIGLDGYELDRDSINLFIRSNVSKLAPANPHTTKQVIARESFSGSGGSEGNGSEGNGSEGSGSFGDTIRDSVSDTDSNNNDSAIDSTESIDGSKLGFGGSRSVDINSINDNENENGIGGSGDSRRSNGESDSDRRSGIRNAISKGSSKVNNGAKSSGSTKANNSAKNNNLSNNSTINGTINGAAGNTINKSIPHLSSISSLSSLFDDSQDFLTDSINLRYATVTKNFNFHKIFNNIPPNNNLLNEFSCSYIKDNGSLINGKLFCTESFFGFYSTFLGWSTKVDLPLKNVEKLKFDKTIISLLIDNKWINLTNFVSVAKIYDFLLMVYERQKAGSPNVGDNSLIDDADASLIQEEALDESLIEDYIMSIDGDDPSASSLSTSFSSSSRPSFSSDRTLIRSRLTKIRKFKSESKYTTSGPDIHSRTIANYDPDPNEIDLIDETFSAPMGVVFNILFSSSNTLFHKARIVENAGSDISDYGDFSPLEDDPSLSKRSYTYRKGLGYSIGPKSTKCEVDETIHNLNYADYIMIVTSTRTPEVPLGKSFSVQTRYVLTWDENNQTNLKLSYFNHWTGTSWIKGVIDKQTQAGQQDAANSLILALHKEIENTTYFIDGPSKLLISEDQALIKSSRSIKSNKSTKSNRSKRSELIKSVKIKENLSKKSKLSSIFNSTSVLSFLSLIIVLLIFFQFKTYEKIIKNHNLTQKHLLLNTHLLLENHTGNYLVEIYPNEFWETINRNVGKILTSSERLDYLLDQMDILYIENTGL